MFIFNKSQRTQQKLNQEAHQGITPANSVPAVIHFLFDIVKTKWFITFSGLLF